MSGPVRVERAGHVLRITLARPERRNALDAALIDALEEAFADVGDARAVVLAGDGPSFCAGADLAWMRAGVELDAAGNVADAQRLARLFRAVDGCPAPVVARVQGNAIAGGSGLVATSDIAIAARDARFAFTEVRLGIIPATISPYVIARVGVTAARRYLLTGELLDAAEALRIGLVAAVADDLDEAVEGVVAALVANGPDAVRATKRLVRERPDEDELVRRIAAARTSEEGQAGLRAFLERREPPWRSP